MDKGGLATGNKKLEECSVANSWSTWIFSTAGALLAIPVGIKRKSFGPLVFFGTTGIMLDILMGINACEKEFAERQKMFESQTSESHIGTGVESEVE